LGFEFGPEETHWVIDQVLDWNWSGFQSSASSASHGSIGRLVIFPVLKDSQSRSPRAPLTIMHAAYCTSRASALANFGSRSWIVYPQLLSDQTLFPRWCSVHTWLRTPLFPGKSIDSLFRGPCVAKDHSQTVALVQWMSLWKTAARAGALPAARAVPAGRAARVAGVTG